MLSVDDLCNLAPVSLIRFFVHALPKEKLLVKSAMRGKKLVVENKKSRMSP